MNHSDLMQDRHLDQILMCAVYVICKVSEGLVVIKFPVRIVKLLLSRFNHCLIWLIIMFPSYDYWWGGIQIMN